MALTQMKQKKTRRLPCERPALLNASMVIPFVVSYGPDFPAAAGFERCRNSQRYSFGSA